MTPAELDFFRAKLLVDDPILARIVCAAPLERDFTGKPMADELAALQERYFELRHRFQTTRSRTTLEKLAGRVRCDPKDFVQSLKRLDERLSRASTGWRDSRGVVHRFACDNPQLETCPHGRELAPGFECERCDADQRQADAL